MGQWAVYYTSPQSFIITISMSQLIKIRIKVPKVDEPTNKKRYYNTLGTSLINSLMSPPSMTGCCVIYTGQKSKFTLH